MSFWNRLVLVGLLLALAITLGFVPMWLSGTAGTVVILASLFASNERGWWSFSHRQAERFRRQMAARKAPIITLSPTEFRRIRVAAE